MKWSKNRVGWRPFFFKIWAEKRSLKLWLVHIKIKTFVVLITPLTQVIKDNRANCTNDLFVAASFLVYHTDSPFLLSLTVRTCRANTPPLLTKTLRSLLFEPSTLFLSLSSGGLPRHSHPFRVAVYLLHSLRWVSRSTTRFTVHKVVSLSSPSDSQQCTQSSLPCLRRPFSQFI